MRDDVQGVVDRLAGSRSFAWLRLIDDARLDEPVEVEDGAADVVLPYRWLLVRIGDGVKLTQAGYLPPVVVSEAMTALGWETAWVGKGNREDLTVPVLDLRESAQRLGLVRATVGGCWSRSSAASWWTTRRRCGGTWLSACRTRGRNRSGTADSPTCC